MELELESMSWYWYRYRYWTVELVDHQHARRCVRVAKIVDEISIRKRVSVIGFGFFESNLFGYSAWVSKFAICALVAFSSVGI